VLFGVGLVCGWIGCVREEFLGGGGGWAVGPNRGGYVNTQALRSFPYSFNYLGIID